MEMWTVGGQFVAVFVAAFLAFGLENVRERRRVARWVREHLRHVQELAAPDLAEREHTREVLRDYATSLDRWLAAEKPDDLTEADWNRLGTSFSSTAPDMGSILRTEAVTVLPQPLALATARLEAEGKTTALVTDNLRRACEDILPAWHERRVPLSDADASRVRRVQRRLRTYEEVSDRHLESLKEMLTALDQWRR